MCGSPHSSSVGITWVIDRPDLREEGEEEWIAGMFGIAPFEEWSRNVER